MKIGNVDLEGSVVLAPMAGITDPPFRRTVQRFGVSALWTEMISAHGLVIGRMAGPTMDLEGHHAPTFFQIYGHDPVIMSEAAGIIQDRGAAAVDLNMGCPSRKVVKNGGGVALMKDLPLAGRIVAAVRRAVKIPLTVKIRSGWDEEAPNAPDLARTAEGEGADAIVVHARSRSKRHSGPASMSIISQVKEAVMIPVIGNGGIVTAENAHAMTARTGCDGVMVGRGALGRPWLPGTILGRFSPGPEGFGPKITFFDVIREHYAYQLQWTDLLRGVRRMRKHLVWYSRGFPGAAGFRRTVLRMEDPVHVMESVEEFFGKVVIS